MLEGHPAYECAPSPFPSGKWRSNWGVSPALPLPPQAPSTLSTFPQFSCLLLPAEKASLLSRRCGPIHDKHLGEHSPVHSFGFSEQQVLEKAPENRASLQLPCCLSSTGPKKMVRTYSRSLSHTVVLRKPPRFHPGRATLHREIWKLLHHDCHYQDTFHSLAMF